MISIITYHVNTHPFLRLCNQCDSHHIHPDSWLPSAVKKMIMHTIISLSLSASAFVSPGAFHMKHRHPSTLNCNVSPSLTRHPQCVPFKPLGKTTHAAVFCLLLYPLRSHAVCHSFGWFRNLWVSFYFSCALWFSVLFSCLCNLHNFVLFFSDCVEGGHGPWLSCLLDTVGLLNHAKREQKNFKLYFFIRKYIPCIQYIICKCK